MSSPTRTPRRRKPNYLYSVVSMALVLFVLGIVATILLQVQRLSVNMRESVEIQMELPDDLSEADGIQFAELLKTEPYTRSAEYVSREQAAAIMQDQLGEDFTDLLGFNPLFASVNLRLRADYALVDSIEMLRQDWMATGNVQDITYDAGLLQAINRNIRRFAFIVLGLAGLLFAIALILMDNTIRLSMFSNRFLIRSMKLVGATHGYITRPFVLKGVFNGLVSGILAALAMIGLFYAVEQRMEGLAFFDDVLLLVAVVAGMLALGVLISLTSTWLAVRKYMNMKLDNLY